jgi:hypothetical protein
MRNSCRILVAIPERKRPFGRPRRKWEDNIKMNVKGIGCDVVDWIQSTQTSDRLL